MLPVALPLRTKDKMRSDFKDDKNYSFILMAAINHIL